MAADAATDLAAATRLDFRLKKHTRATLRSRGCSAVSKRRPPDDQIRTGRHSRGSQSRSSRHSAPGTPDRLIRPGSRLHLVSRETRSLTRCPAVPRAASSPPIPESPQHEARSFLVQLIATPWTGFHPMGPAGSSNTGRLASSRLAADGGAHHESRPAPAKAAAPISFHVKRLQRTLRSSPCGVARNRSCTGAAAWCSQAASGTPRGDRSGGAQ